MPKINTILMPIDFSDPSQQALDLAFALSRDLQARLIVLHVASPPPSVPYNEFEKVLHESSDVRRELEEKLRQCQKPDCNAEFRLQEGDPADEIIRMAQETHCDLIVMGTHGRSGLAHLLMGSVAEKVLRRASCPVLTVKAGLPDHHTSSPSQSQETMAT